ncbi:unnamed protein product [Heterobilharzia americana]|nr:unnamed protein product [Heterobilharzia americana]
MIERQQNNNKNEDEYIFRKPTRLHRRLNYYFAHTLTTKLTVSKSLINRANRLMTMEEDKNNELKLIRSVLKTNNYPDRFVRRILKNEVKNSLKCHPKKWINTGVISFCKEI